MGERTGIAWTHSTFNPWQGCQKVSPACANCYAETMDSRFFPGAAGHWGPGSSRRFFGDKHWNDPIRWNKAAEKEGVRHRVFCASMADVFEDRQDLVEPRLRLWKLIEATPWLDWLLLTKRPENIGRMLPRPRLIDDGHNDDRYVPYFSNVWLGTTVESQEWAEDRIPHLLSNLAVVHFLSCEPLLGPLSLYPWMIGAHARRILRESPGYNPDIRLPEHLQPPPSIDWVITGCESGPDARPTELAWYRSLRDQCTAADIAFFFKQGMRLRGNDTDSGDSHRIEKGAGSWEKGRDLIEQPYLDGEQWIEVPEPRDL